LTQAVPPAARTLPLTLRTNGFLCCNAVPPTMALAYEIHHPNLRDAYGATESAIHHIQEAQATNKGIEFGGHAEKALEALRHAEQEIIAGDQWNDAHHR
jgi:hypothetical protein